MLNCAARDIDKPVADLPADFEAQLRAMGYIGVDSATNKP